MGRFCATNFHVLGSWDDQFDGAQNHILAALNSALDLLEFKVSETDSKEFHSNKFFIVHEHNEQLKNQIEI